MIKIGLELLSCVNKDALRSFFEERSVCVAGECMEIDDRGKKQNEF